MGEPIVLEDFKERVILVGVSEQDGDDAEDSLAELAELVKTAGASVAGTLIQKRELIHPGTYVGTGKVAEIAELLEHTGATGIVCDDELSPAPFKKSGDDVKYQGDTARDAYHTEYFPRPCNNQ